MPAPRHRLPQLVKARYDRLVARLREPIWTGLGEVAVEVADPGPSLRPLSEAKRGRFRRLAPGSWFADHDWAECWFRIRIPKPGRGERGRRVLFWDAIGETTVYVGERPWAGLDIAHPYCVLPDEGSTLHLRCGLWQTGIWAKGEKIHPRHGLRFDGAHLALRDEDAWSLFHDADVLRDLLVKLVADDGLEGKLDFGYLPPLEEVSPLLRRMLDRLDRACDAFDRDGPEALRRALRRVYRDFPAEDWQPAIGLTGHAHIDLVWLWPEASTVHKGVHTASTVLRLMERYPEFRFGLSQPALYNHIAAAEPEFFAEIRKRIREGRWEATGGMEVEADTLLPSGEGLCRGFYHGQEQFRAIAGEESDVTWIPDVFGYSAALPQIMAQAGVRRFFTTKLTWSAISRFPHTSLRWRGNDGTEVVTHLTPCGYNGDVRLGDHVDHMRRHRQLQVHDELLLPVGHGDGGGGPTEEMCERARRMADLVHTPTHAWTRIDEFFDRLEEVADELPVYHGELYLEYHRGTFTTQSRFKYLHRRLEVALQAHEAVRVVRGGPALGYDDWRRLLFTQFHDAIPGSSIGRVYEELEPELDGLVAERLAAARDELAEGGDGRGRLLFNPLPMPRRALVEFTRGELTAAMRRGLRRPDGAAVPVQASAFGDRCHLAAIDLEGLGSARVVSGAGEGAEHPSPSAEPGELRNDRLRASFDARGRLRALAIDGRTIDLVAPATFSLHEDHPAKFDAWDIDQQAYALGVPVADRLELEVLENGPVRAALRGVAEIGERSRMVVTWSCFTGSDVLDVEVDVDWHEDHRLLRFNLPTGYRGRDARFGSPFGSTLRPQVPGTDRDEAMWEVPGSRWAMVGDDHGDDGVAILTEAKYGFSCRDGELGLSLLRAPTHPDERADRGRHRIRFAIAVARGTSDRQGLCTAAAADARYAPVVVAAKGALAPPPFALEDPGSLVASWAFPAHESEAKVIRLHETMGRRGTARLVLQRPGRVRRVDVLENPGAELKGKRGRIFEVPYRPYELISVAVGDRQ